MLKTMFPGFHRTKIRSEEHTSELQSQSNLVCRLLLEKKKTSHRQGGSPRPPRFDAAVSPHRQRQPTRVCGGVEHVRPAPHSPARHSHTVSVRARSPRG